MHQRKLRQLYKSKYIQSSNESRPTLEHNPSKRKPNKNRINNRNWNQTKPNTIKPTHTFEAYIKSFLTETPPHPL